MTDTQHGNNGGDEGRILDSIDRDDDELDRIKSDYMLACKGPRGRIREAMKAAKQAEIDIVAFREVLRTHRFERKQAKRLDQLEPDNRMNYDVIMERLGGFADTPLGQAALSKARPPSGGDQTLNSLS